MAGLPLNHLPWNKQKKRSSHDLVECFQRCLTFLSDYRCLSWTLSFEIWNWYPPFCACKQRCNECFEWWVSHLLSVINQSDPLTQTTGMPHLEHPKVTVACESQHIPYKLHNCTARSRTSYF
jgi:hypothetical protein